MPDTPRPSRPRRLLPFAVGMGLVLIPPLIAAMLGAPRAWVTATFAIAVALATLLTLGLITGERRLTALRRRHANRVCVTCHYPLAQGVPEGTCPECGDAYTLHDVQRHWEAVEDEDRRLGRNPYRRT